MDKFLMNAARPAGTSSRVIPVDEHSRALSLLNSFFDVALINASTAAAVGGMGLTWWYDQVRAGVAPQPVIRGPRCTRWQAADVREFWRQFVAEHAADTQPGQSPSGPPQARTDHPSLALIRRADTLATALPGDACDASETGA